MTVQTVIVTAAVIAALAYLGLAGWRTWRKLASGGCGHSCGGSPGADRSGRKVSLTLDGRRL